MCCLHCYLFNKAQANVPTSHSVGSSGLNLGTCGLVTCHHHLIFKNNDEKTLISKKIVFETESHGAKVGLKLWARHLDKDDLMHCLHLPSAGLSLCSTLYYIGDRTQGLAQARQASLQMVHTPSPTLKFNGEFSSFLCKNIFIYFMYRGVLPAWISV